MHHFFEAITNTAGDSLIGYFARVINRTTQNTVTLSSDENGTPIVVVSGVENMAKSDDFGNLSLYVEPGTYHLDIYAPNTTTFLYRVSDVAMNSTKGDPGEQGEQGDPGNGLSDTFSQTGTGSVQRTGSDELRDWFSPKQFGATGSGNIAASESLGFSRAITAVRNPNDASFSGAVNVPPGIYRLTGEIGLPQSFGYISADRGATIWGASGSHVLRANGASFVQSELKGVRLYGGVDGLRADTAGEIASNVLEDVSVTAHTGNGFYFSIGLTSSVLERLTVTGGTTALRCAAGINNNNTVSDCHFYNTTDDTIKIDGQSNAWQFRNVHIEGGGQLTKAQYSFASPVCNHILGGWSEGGGEFLVKVTADPTDVMGPGVIIDGLTSIGSSNQVGGFVASKFSVGNNRIVFGSNQWDILTTAPARVFIYGVNRRLKVQGSQVWTRDTNVDKRVVPVTRTVVDTGSQTFPLFTIARPDAANVTTNQQAITIKCTLQFTGYDGGGNARGGVWEALIYVQGAGAVISSVIATVGSPVGNVGGATLVIQQGTLSSTQSTVNAVLQGLNFGLPNIANFSLEVLNVSIAEENGFSFSV